MGKIYERIDEQQREWIARQPLFFVGTAPLAADGHVNVSPKGPIGSLRVLDDHTIAYLDAYGSGTETVGHVRENGRIVVMLCAFDGPPRILRLHGSGRVLPSGSAEYEELLARESFADPSTPASRRAIIVVDVTRVADSCGYGVPEMSFVADREHLPLAHAKKERVNGERYHEVQVTRNAFSIDGLPALAGLDDGGTMQRDSAGDKPDAAEVT
jgi:predicted pyridoxine 5'-phosphate oxidase superfamily flavin-nucleotide-binding protein